MTVDDELILKLEQLARLHLKDSERKELKKDLEEIIRMIDKLNELDTTDVTPLMHLTNRSNVMREDRVEPELSVDEALENAPEKEKPYFKVPKVIKRDS